MGGQMDKLEKLKVVVQLKDGREITFNDTATEIVTALKAQGVKLSDIKNTIHVIPRGTITPARPK
jgi:hypothetical protein